MAKLLASMTLGTWRLREPAVLALVLAGCLLSQFVDGQPAIIIVTNSADTGPGTLRQAIADSVSGDTITFALEDTNVITLTNGQLVITNNLTIISSNTPIAIDAGGFSRVMEIAASNAVTLDTVIVTNGNVAASGGGIFVDNGAVLTLTNCTVSGNSAALGGGIFVSPNGSAAILNSIFSANTATDNGGAIDNETNGSLAVVGSTFAGNGALRGGAIFNNFATNFLNGSGFFTNSAGDGGAIANFDSLLVATNLNVSSNYAAAGGGIFNLNPNAVLILSDSTLSKNIGTNFGGGIMNTNGGTAAINDTTIFDNASPADQGGGIENLSTITINNCTISGSPSGGGFVNLGGTAVCNNSTFYGNVALFDGGGVYAFFGTAVFNNCTISSNSARRRAGGIYENSSSLFLTNTIIAGNTAVTSDPNFVGSFSGANNLTNGDPLLAPPGDYGGPTPTMPLLGGSPAINAGVDSVTNLFLTDQRGFARKASLHVDIGAVEVQPVVVMNTNDNGPGSFRDAAATAPELITFTNILSGQTIYLTNGQITVSNPVGIDASDLAERIRVDGGGASRVLEITGSNVVTLDSLIVTNGNVSDRGGGILVDSGVMLTLANCIVAGNSADAGGGMYISSNSTVAISSSIFFANSATNTGGAMEGDTNSAMTVINSAFTANSAASGGGVFNLFGSETFNTCIFSNNAATSDSGGGIFNAGSLALNNCTLEGNHPGGGIAQSSGQLAVNNSTVSHNSSAQSGGGLSISGGQSTLNNCTLFGNSAESSNGGGIAVDGDTTNTLNNCTISGNSAGIGGGLYQYPGNPSLLTNTLVAGNSAGSDPDVFGLVDGANNLTNGNPLLAPFGNYGGPTQTMPPLFGSPAIDAGFDFVTLPATDQRGYPRKSGAHVDIGAVETQLAPANNRPVVLLRRGQSGGGRMLTFTNVPNADFTILSSTNLARPLGQWEILGPALQNLPGSYQFADPAVTNSKARFYEVVSP